RFRWGRKSPSLKPWPRGLCEVAAGRPRRWPRSGSTTSMVGPRVGALTLRQRRRSRIEFHFFALGRTVGEGLEVKIRCHLSCIGSSHGNTAIPVNRITTIAAVDFVGRAQVDLSAGPRSRRSTQRLIGKRVGG